MKKQTKKFIAPGGWFSLFYPNSWHEFEDSEDTFLFYNPDIWTGNFRISAYLADPKRDDGMQYGVNSIRDELRDNSSASPIKVGHWDCAYSKETFQEEGNYYTTHLWITGVANIAFECTFTVTKGGDIQPAEEIIATLEARINKQYLLETIPMRILEIGIVNEAYDWASATVKKQLKKDFTGSKEDLSKLQQLVEKGNYNTKQKDVWYQLGAVLGTILVNEIDGFDWVTVIDGSRELPAIQFKDSDLIVYPQELVWNKIKNNSLYDPVADFDTLREQVIAYLNTNGK